MDKKEEKRRRILPPIEELVGTPDLINEALRKVIPPSPSKERTEKSDSTSSDIVELPDREQKPEKRLQKKSTARPPHSSVIAELGHDDSATISPSHNMTQLLHTLVRNTSLPLNFYSMKCSQLSTLMSRVYSCDFTV